MGSKPQTRRPKKPPKAAAETKEKSQRERFIETARALGVDETGKEFERLFDKVAPPRKRPAQK